MIHLAGNRRHRHIFPSGIESARCLAPHSGGKAKTGGDSIAEFSECISFAVYKNLRASAGSLQT